VQIKPLGRFDSAGKSGGKALFLMDVKKDERGWAATTKSRRELRARRAGEK